MSFAPVQPLGREAASIAVRRGWAMHELCVVWRIRRCRLRRRSTLSKRDGHHASSRSSKRQPMLVRALLVFPAGNKSMCAKSAALCLMVLVSTGLGCAASSGDEGDDGALSTVDSALSPMDDRPEPPRFEPSIPALDRHFGLPTWDLRRYFEEER